MADYAGGIEKFLKRMAELEANSPDGFAVEEQDAAGQWISYGSAGRLFVYRFDELVVLLVAFYGWVGNDQQGVRGHVISRGYFDEDDYLVAEIAGGALWRIRPFDAMDGGREGLKAARAYLRDVQEPTMEKRGSIIIAAFKRNAAALADDWRRGIPQQELEREREALANGDR
jgi:hypothetical protein